MKLALAVVVALGLPACAGPRLVAPHPPVRRNAVHVVMPLPLGPASAVVTLEQEVPTAVARGSFLITAINPGERLDLAFAIQSCDEPGLVWFRYSGGGVAVGAGQLLCASSYAAGSVAHAFSGRNEAGAEPP